MSQRQKVKRHENTVSGSYLAGALPSEYVVHESIEHPVLVRDLGDDYVLIRYIGDNAAIVGIADIKQTHDEPPSWAIFVELDKVENRVRTYRYDHSNVFVLNDITLNDEDTNALNIIMHYVDTGPKVKDFFDLIDELNQCTKGLRCNEQRLKSIIRTIVSENNEE